MKWEFMLVYFTYNIYEGNNTIKYKGKKVYTVEGTHDFLIEKLDEFGAEGWDAYGFGNINSNHILLKRPK
ncbi:MAG: hypothetical protein FWC95_01970 [Defluviitaleaceae bacterium]|nr:hypothetical protein [Defluviitaleaceae bacterium]